MIWRGCRGFVEVASMHPLTARIAAVFDDMTLERFWSKVDKRGPDECWEWRHSKDRKGYGHFWLKTLPPKGRMMAAHRFSWTVNNAVEIPMGMHVLHSCDNPPCVNPAHLSIGTNADNVKDKMEKGRVYKGNVAWNANPSHCRQGHVQSGRNIYFCLRKKTGKIERRCRVCAKNSMKKSA